MAGYRIPPWRQIPGSGQQIDYSSSASVAATNAIGKVTNSQTTAVLIQAVGGDPTTPSAVIVCVAQNGLAASNTSGQVVKELDPPVVIGCAPGDTITALGLDPSGGVLYIVELTH